MKLKNCINIYKTLLNKKFILTLENNIKLEIIFSKSNLKHLLGLHKLTDIPIINNSNANQTYKYICNGLINDKMIKKSIHYNTIENRILYFNILPTLLNSKVIIDFDAHKIQSDYTSKLQTTDFILYKRFNNYIAHLALSKTRFSNYIPQTFFIENSNMYLSEQNILDIIDIEIIDF